MDLIHDVLDQQLIDCTGAKAGKVDGIALEIGDGEAPRVAYLDIGIDVLARRISPRLEPVVKRIRRSLRGEESQPFQVPWSKVRRVAISVVLSIDVRDYSAYYVENWLREHIIEKIPGNAHHKHQEKHD